jgi:hypothetical protein
MELRIRTPDFDALGRTRLGELGGGRCSPNGYMPPAEVADDRLLTPPQSSCRAPAEGISLARAPRVTIR